LDNYLSGKIKQVVFITFLKGLDNSSIYGFHTSPGAYLGELATNQAVFGVYAGGSPWAQLASFVGIAPKPATSIHWGAKH